MSATSLEPEPAMPHPDPGADRFDPRVCAPLLLVHAGGVLAIATGASPTALVVCAGSFAVRMFGITAGYHRCFAHRSFRTGRVLQGVLAWLGACAAQLGPLWWAGHHRLHHRHTDTALDPHSPRLRGRWWAHMGWLLCRRHSSTPLERVRDLARYPELRFLDRWHALAPLSWMVLLYGLGEGLSRLGLGTSGLELVAWGFFVSTVILYHATFAVNSLAHARGGPPGDASRNRPWLALVTLGDGWHANHHRDPASARHGLGVAEPDPCWWLLRGLERLGWVTDLRCPRAPQPALRLPPTTRAAATAPVQAKANRSPTRP